MNAFDPAVSGVTGPDEPQRLFRRPWVSDPLIWIGAVSAVGLGTLSAFGLAFGETGVSAVQVALGSLFAALFWGLLTGLVPATIRKRLAYGRSESLLRQIPESVSPGWYPDPTNLTRYRWWDGSSWQSEVNPAPNARVVGRAGPVLLVLVTPVVLAVSLLISGAANTSSQNTVSNEDSAQQMLEDLQSYLPDSEDVQNELKSRFPSPAPVPSEQFAPQLSDALAISYGTMTQDVYAVAELRPDENGSLSDYSRQYVRRVTRAMDSWDSFNELLNQVSSQRQLGDFPPLDLLRDVDVSVGRFLVVADGIAGDIRRCTTLSGQALALCLESSQSMYGNEYEVRLIAVGETIQALAEAREEQTT